MEVYFRAYKLSLYTYINYTLTNLSIQLLITYKNNFDNTWYLSFDSLEDMRPIIFDFAQENGLKILELSSKNQRLETLFTELTA